MAEDALILVVDDDDRLRALLSRYLSEQGFRVSTAESAAQARERLRFLEPDLLVLDVMMPGETGLSLTEALRRQSAQQGKPDLPVLLLTARGAPEDRIAGFEAGADDYLAKPFDPRELVLRVRAMLRRATPIAAAAPAVNLVPPSGPLPLGSLSFDVQRQELTGPGGKIRLTGGEATLLAALGRRAGEVLSRESLAGELGLDAAQERAVDVQVTRLRRKIEPDSREPRFLYTVRGRGYVLKPGA